MKKLGYASDDMPAARGSRLDRLSEVRPQERVLLRTVEQTIDAAPSLPTLDVLAPQMVDAMVEVLTCTDKPSSVEQVIAVPTIDFPPQGPVPRETQTVEQLVDVPVPQTALLRWVLLALVVAWRQMLATEHAAHLLAPPYGMDRQPRAGHKTGQG